jgi:hypothetical protein
MTAPRVIAYSICRRCAAVHPTERLCPSCDDDHEAAAAIAMATACAIEPSRAVPPLPRSRRLLAPLIAVCAVMLGLGVGLGWMFAADHDPRVKTSATDEADR